MSICEKRQDFAFFYYDTTDSTNTRAREYVMSFDNAKLPAMFVAECQTEGRGRMGRSFYSPGGGGLYMSLVLTAPKSEKHFTCLTSLCAIAAARSVKDVLGIKVKIKWVNDLYLYGKKVAGILAESFEHNGQRYVVLGMGINISTKVFPPELADVAGCLLDVEASQDTKQELAMHIAKSLLSMLNSNDISEYMAEYKQLSCVIGKEILFVEGGVTKQGKAVDITPLGALVVEHSYGDTVVLSSGEISVRICDKCL